MNKRVFTSMLSLCVIFLCGLYIAKIFFPQEFVMVISNEQMIKIGSYIDSHLWLRYLCAGITSFITYWLFCCACARRLYLKWYECLEIIGTIILIRVISLYDVNLSTSISVISFVFLPALTGGNLKNCAIVYLTHGISQVLSLSIRNLPIYLSSINFVTITLLGLESCIWLVLLYIVFNYKEKKNEN